MSIFSNRRRRQDRGAVLPEYALIIALVVVGSLGLIQNAQTRGTSRLAASGARVSATDGGYYAGGVATTAPTVAPPTTVVGAVGVHLAAAPLITVGDASDPNRWQVTVTLTLLDSANNGVIGATVNGNWTDGGGGSTPVGSCTTSTSAGQCTLQFTRIRDAYPTVTFTLATITGGSFTWTPVAGGEGTYVIPCGTFC